MAKWATNSQPFKEVWRTDGVDFKEVTQTLGIDWDAESDTLAMDPRDVTGEYVEGPTTKSQVLQTTARFYDPLGLSPCIGRWEINISSHVVQRMSLIRTLAV
jgi:hypothetical protein